MGIKMIAIMAALAVLPLAGMCGNQGQVDAVLVAIASNDVSLATACYSSIDWNSVEKPAKELRRLSMAMKGRPQWQALRKETKTKHLLVCEPTDEPIVDTIQPTTVDVVKPVKVAIQTSPVVMIPVVMIPVDTTTDEMLEWQDRYARFSDVKAKGSPAMTTVLWHELQALRKADGPSYDDLLGKYSVGIDRAVARRAALGRKPSAKR